VLTVSLSFKSGFSGLKWFYAMAQDYGGLQSTWQTLGSWTVGVNQAPVPVSMTPSSGSGWSQVFQFAVSDPNGWQDVHWMLVIVNGPLNGRGACYLNFNRSQGALWLANDEASGWVGGLLGSGGTVENSQCQVRLNESGVTGSGNTLVLTVSLSFKSGFSGLKWFYAMAQDYGGLQSTWQTLGSWTVPGS